MNGAGTRTRAWMEIVRPPNLFTVPGDPLAGFFLMTALFGHARLTDMIWPTVAALLIYIAGLIGNDVADAEEDRRDRPTRPIPSGRIKKSTAFVVSGCLAGIGLAVSAIGGAAVLAMACLAQLSVMVYNGGLKRTELAGSFVMGLCRGFSFLMGCAAATGTRGVSLFPAILAATVFTLYIFAVTWIAYRETTAEEIGNKRWLPMLVLLAGLGAIYWLIPPFNISFLMLGVLSIGWAGYIGWRLRGVPTGPVLGSSIGCLIRGLLLLQATVCSAGGAPGLAAAAVLLILWPLSAIAGKRFYAS